MKGEENREATGNSDYRSCRFVLKSLEFTNCWFPNFDYINITILILILTVFRCCHNLCSAVYVLGEINYRRVTNFVITVIMMTTMYRMA